MISRVTGSFTWVRRGCFSPCSGADSTINETSPLAIPCNMQTCCFGLLHTLHIFWRDVQGLSCGGQLFIADTRWHSCMASYAMPRVSDGTS